ncbi:MAG TPA: hypothetical protein DEA08_17970, partial [Planctomycetes bacterium]|nr:hypothetical protein [Planctomycetota bacterium]
MGLFLLALTSSAAAEEVQAYLGGSYEPNSGQTLHMSVWGASDIEVSEYKLTSAQLGEALRPNALHLDVATLQASKTVRFNDQRGQVPVADAPGVYVYVARGSGVQRTQARAVVVSDLKVAVKRDDESSLFLVQRGDRLASRPRIRVYEAADHQSKPTLLRSYRARSGVAYLRTTSTKSLIYVVESAGQVAIQTAHDRTWSANTARYQVHASTDRPLYRPGHTANFKVIVRERVGDRSHRTPSDEEVRVLLRDPSGNKTTILAAKTNRFGTVSGSTVIPASAALGEYGLEVQVGPRQTGVTHPTTHGYASFGVQAYRKPEFKVEVAAGSPQIVMGSPVQAEVEARYFFGAPVANAQVEWTVTKRNRWRWWNPWIRPLVYDAMPSLWWPRYNDQVVARGNGTTDASGKLSLAVATQREDHDADYEITAKVVDAANREVKGGGSVAVTRAAFDLLLVSNRYCYEPGDLIELQANLQHMDGSPAAPTAVSFEIEELDKDGNATPRLTLDRMSDARGEVSLRLRARTTNHYRVTAKALDADGNEVSATRSFWIADETGARDWSFDRVELTADKDAYEPGDTAVILVRGPVSSGYGVVTVEGLEIKRAFGVRLFGGLGLVKIPVTEAMTPNAFVSCLIAGDEQPQTGSVELNVPPVNKIVDVQIVADKAEYRPGETATFTLKTTDANGQPVAAEVALGVVDEALFALREDQAPELATTFFPRDYNRVHTLGAASYGGGFFPGGPVFLETAVMTMARDSSRKSADQQQSKVREYFPDTMLWLAHVETNAQGEATISQELADSLTTWRLTARAVTEQDELGQTKTTTLVRKDLIVRLAAPRALVEGDELELVGIVHNLAQEGATGAENASVRLRLEADGVELLDAAHRTVIVPREGETEVTWRVRVREGKLATLTLRGDASFDSDALRLRL